jgi:pilus assembly protein CpaB
MRRKARSFWSANPAGKVRKLFPPILGLLLAGAALAIASRRISGVEKEIRDRSNPVEVVVAASPIASGDAFHEGNLARKSVPASGTGRRNVPAAEYALLVGGRARNPVDPGEPILWTDVEEPYDVEPFSRGISPGFRALTLRVDASSSFAGMLHPGDRVDLLCEPEGNGTGGARWSRDLSVAAVDRHHDRIGKLADAQDVATVTLLVTPQEGARIAASASAGRIHWFLRNPEDNAVVSPMNKSHPGRSVAVEIWKAGLREDGSPPGKAPTL